MRNAPGKIWFKAMLVLAMLVAVGLIANHATWQDIGEGLLAIART